MDNSSQSRKWFEFAQDDLSWSKASFKDGFLKGACFAAQQAAEKALKAYIISQGKNIKKIHDIRALLEECLKTDESFEELREECSTLNSYYAPTRYPDIGEFMDFNEKNAKEAYSFAENILSFIEKKLSVK